MMNTITVKILLVVTAGFGVNGSTLVPKGISDEVPAPANPVSYDGYALNPERTPFTGIVPPDSHDDTCGLTCRGPDQYAFGLFACLRTSFNNTDGIIPNVTLDEDGTLVLPKVIFSPSTAYSDFSLKEYDQGRRAYLGSRLPGAILYAESEEDVIKGVNCARVNGYKVSPRGRGHDYSGMAALEGTLVIDVQLTCQFDRFVTDTTSLHSTGEWILPGSRYIGRMKVAGGCSNAVLMVAANEKFDKGAMTITGDCPSVGVTGFFLNGGFGDQSPYAGLGADVVDEIEMVLYNGTLITASTNENEDIFWASKGGTGGLGVITNIWVRIVQCPNPTKFTYVSLKLNTFDTERTADQLMRFQDFLLDDPESVLFGGEGGASEMSGVFLGSIKKAVSVFSNAGLLDEKSMSTKQNSTAYRNGVLLCGGNEKPSCKEKFSNNYPQVGLELVQVNTQAEVQAIVGCITWFTLESFPFSLIATARTFDLCRDLKLDAEYCFKYPIPLVPESLHFSFILGEKCYQPEVIKAIVNAAREPTSFYNRKGLSADSILFLETARLYPNSIALGVNGYTVGMGTGGLMLPRLERTTYQALIEANEDVFLNHLTHGAPLQIHPDSTGYPHRNTWGVTQEGSRGSEYINTLLKDSIFLNDVINLQIYGNYNPSMRIPNYETHVFVDHTESLSKIRTKHDPLGGFDSPRYVSRNRNKLRTAPLVPINIESIMGCEDDPNKFKVCKKNTVCNGNGDVKNKNCDWVSKKPFADATNNISVGRCDRQLKPTRSGLAGTGADKCPKTCLVCQ